jgi:hypothetical protein
MMRGVSTGENAWGLEERNIFLSDILGLLLFQGTQQLLADPESLYEMPMRWTHK